ncbi:DUF4304 domain-containing protein [Luteolibacter arcticus]|uniref:DUF4304 domain-containing protein n=1 Tax=Luteolibacter arcticus TaxID=1581411 RepID=A0ABT3GG78_9BACT|nr:DUF4304 domain-containing protein [Luteolibacter arcticus]MCW1922612.1 DUF4304 domain-containing protein [Luteolibacter arcticus]
MPTAQNVIKEAISALHALHLKGLGFRKDGSTWVRASKWPQVINLQLSSWNTADDARVTLNLGVFVEELRQALGESPLKGKLKEYDCSPRARIGQLRPGGQDHWWKVTPLMPPDTLADELFAELADHGMPWLERMDSFEGLAREFEKEKTYFKAAAAFHLAGLPSEAEAKMAEALSDSNEHFLPRLQRIAGSLGIPIRA